MTDRAAEYRRGLRDALAAIRSERLADDADDPEGYAYNEALKNAALAVSRLLEEATRSVTRAAKCEAEVTIRSMEHEHVICMRPKGHNGSHHGHNERVTATWTDGRTYATRAK